MINSKTYLEPLNKKEEISKPIIELSKSQESNSFLNIFKYLFSCVTNKSVVKNNIEKEVSQFIQEKVEEVQTKVEEKVEEVQTKIEEKVEEVQTKVEEEIQTKIEEINVKIDIE